MATKKITKSKPVVKKVKTEILSKRTLANRAKVAAAKEKVLIDKENLLRVVEEKKAKAEEEKRTLMLEVARVARIKRRQEELEREASAQLAYDSLPWYKKLFA